MEQSSSGALHREVPVETGKRLTTLPRGDREEVRVNWDEFNGRKFLNIRLWWLADDGAWVPDTKRGITVRVGELLPFQRAVAAAILEAHLV